MRRRHEGRPAVPLHAPPRRRLTAYGSGWAAPLAKYLMVGYPLTSYLEHSALLLVQSMPAMDTGEREQGEAWRKTAQHGAQLPASASLSTHLDCCSETRGPLWQPRAWRSCSVRTTVRLAKGSEDAR